MWQLLEAVCADVLSVPSGTTIRILAPEIFTLCFLALMQLHQFSHPKGWSCLGAGSKKSSRSLPATRIPSSWRRSVRHSLDWNPVTWKSAHLVTVCPYAISWGLPFSRWEAKPSLKSFGAMDATSEHHTAWRCIFHLDALLHPTPSLHTGVASTTRVSRASPTASRGAWVPFFRGHMRNDSDRKPKAVFARHLELKLLNVSRYFAIIFRFMHSESVQVKK